MGPITAEELIETACAQTGLADTGLDAGSVRDRARRYVEYFDVQSEPADINDCAR